MHTELYNLPVLLYNEGLLHLALPSKDHLLYNKFFIFAAEYIHRTLHCSEDSHENTFSFIRFINLSPMEMNKIFIAGTLFRCVSKHLCWKNNWLFVCWLQFLSYALYACFRLCLITLMEQRLKMVQYWENWCIDNKSRAPTNQMFYLPRKMEALSATSQDLLFTRKIIEGEAIYVHTAHTIHSMPETVAHRILRSSKKSANQLTKVSTIYLHYTVRFESSKHANQCVWIFSYREYFLLTKWNKQKTQN